MAIKIGINITVNQWYAQVWDGMKKKQASNV